MELCQRQINSKLSMKNIMRGEFRYYKFNAYIKIKYINTVYLTKWWLQTIFRKTILHARHIIILEYCHYCVVIIYQYLENETPRVSRSDKCLNNAHAVWRMATFNRFVLSVCFPVRTSKKDGGRHPENDKLKRLRFTINVVFIHFPDRQTCHLFCSKILLSRSYTVVAERGGLEKIKRWKLFQLSDGKGETRKR